MNETERHRQRAAFVESELGEEYKTAKASEDASFRSYWRATNGESSRIVMDAPPDREALEPFLEVAERLRRSGVRTPEIHAQDRARGFLLLEDFGFTLFADQLGKTVEDDRTQGLLSQAFCVLDAMQRTDTAELPEYDDDKLVAEMNLFTEWTLNRQLKDLGAPPGWSSIVDLLLDNVRQQPKCFVHRDFHCGNLMVLEDEAGVLDFQDAVAGPATYDLASLIWDRYLEWPRNQVVQWAERARTAWYPAVDSATWLRWLDLMGVQRNLKIVGIFARLSLRDGKHSYLQWQPRFLRYLIDVTQRHAELGDLHDFLSTKVAPRLA